MNSTKKAVKWFRTKRNPVKMLSTCYCFTFYEKACDRIKKNNDTIVHIIGFYEDSLKMFAYFITKINCNIK